MLLCLPARSVWLSFPRQSPGLGHFFAPWFPVLPPSLALFPGRLPPQSASIRDSCLVFACSLVQSPVVSSDSLPLLSLVRTCSPTTTILAFPRPFCILHPTLRYWFLSTLNRICTPIPLHTRTRPPFRTRSPTLHSSTSVIGNANLHHPISHPNNCKSHFRFTTQPTGSRRDLDIPPLLFHIVHLAYLISRALSLPQTASVRSLSSIKHCDSSHTPARQTSAWSLV